MRFFNTAGPIKPDWHYCIPPLERLDADNVLGLIGQGKYFVLHAPRQTGKTSTLLALRDQLNADGAYRCVYVNVEVGQAAREDAASAMRAILSQLAREAEVGLGDSAVQETWTEALDRSGPHDALQAVLARWASSDPRPSVLLIDEIDALVGDTLISVLRQLRSGYANRPRHFPQSVILCGVRDVRDYRIRASSEREMITGGSAFNIKAESLRLGDFSAAQTESLLAQHTDETGQRWTSDARAEVWRLTAGQPWLVNALAYRAAEAISDHDRPIGAAAISEARERLIASRETHLDQLADKLAEPRVRRVVEPLLSGRLETESERIPVDDLQYVADLGLVRTDGGVRIANPIYAEVIPRELTWTTQVMLPFEGAWYLQDGDLRVDRLLEAFQGFFREHSEHWVQRFEYREAGPQLLLQAFLQRVVNAGGRIEREYGLGRMRTDLLVLWPAGEAGEAAAGRRSLSRTVVECKLLYGGLERTTREGLAQTRAYMDRCGATEGHLVIFDRSEDRTWDEKIYRRTVTADGPPVTVWGM
ncbi:MAG: ATP-binding protein [bacterium]|nr:ATP-binding protein [bacterium]